MVRRVVEEHKGRIVALIVLIAIIGIVGNMVKQQFAMHYFIPLLYYIPVIFATYFFHLSGGLTAALVSTFLCIPLIVNSTQPWLANIVMIEMISFFIVSYTVSNYLHTHVRPKEEKFELPPEDLLNVEEMEKGLRHIEPIIKADRERVAFCQMVANIYAFHSLEEKLGVILNIIKNEFTCQACSILLLENKPRELKVKISRGLSGSFLKQVHLQAEDGVWAKVIKKRTEVLIEKGKTETSHVLENEFQTFLALPLISRQQVLGVLHLESAHARAFSPIDVEIIWDFANLIAILIDNANLLEENRSLAVIDKNTGLFNYHYFHQKVEAHMKEQQRYGKIFSMIVIELVDYYKFKTFHGKERTNELLREMALAIKSCLRGVDLVTRIGEKEFSIVLPETDIDGAHISAERINTKVTQDVFDGIEPDILFCLGAVEFPRDGKDLPSIIGKARTNIHEVCRAKHHTDS